MEVIKFGERFCKIPEDIENKATILLQIFVVDRNDLSPEFVAYDTSYENRLYCLPSGKLIVLLLNSDGELWTTVRRWTPEKEQNYRSLMGSLVKIEIEGE